MSAESKRDAARDNVRLQGQSLLGWALRRTLIGVVILTVTVSTAAWLLYAAIDPDSEASAALVKGQAPVVQPSADPPSLRPSTLP